MERIVEGIPVVIGLHGKEIEFRGIKAAVVSEVVSVSEVVEAQAQIGALGNGSGDFDSGAERGHLEADTDVRKFRTIVFLLIRSRSGKTKDREKR